MAGFQPLMLALAAATAAELGGRMPAALVRPCTQKAKAISQGIQPAPEVLSKVLRAQQIQAP